MRVMAGHRIDTDRLVLRSPIAGDAPEISRLLGNWQVAHWLVRVPFPYRTEHAELWIKRSAEERAAGQGWPFLMVLAGSNKIVGSMDLSLESDDRTGTLGYWLGEDYWGQGLATEAARAVIRFAFEIAQLDQVNASALPDNARSMRVLEKAGLAHVERRYEDTVERGRVDIEFFALDRDVWDYAR
jgi:RimJ/RimL family protein N-acetyltransferase